MKGRRATLKLVAEAAGVSVGTVSNVVTGRRSVRPSTRAAVEAAIARLGYKPDETARALIARRNRPRAEPPPTTPRLTAIGYVCADHRAEVPVLPHRDDRRVAASIDQRLGGRAANVAVTAAGLGKPLEVAATVLSLMGEESDSDWAEGLLTARGVRLHPASRRQGGRLSRCIIMVEPSGHRTILNEPLQVPPEVVAVWLDGERVQTAPHAVYAQADQLEVLLATLRCATAKPMRLVTHLSGDHVARLGAKATLALVRGFDLVVLDRAAARRLSGPAGGDAGLAQRLAPMMGDVARRAALTLGADGAVLLVDGAIAAEAPAPALVPVDTTGAGDTFTGCLTTALLHDVEPATALTLAVTAASRSVLCRGAQDHGLTAAQITS